MSEDMYAPTSAEPEKPRKKSKGIWATILIPALIFGFFDTVSEKVGEAAGNHISEQREISNIEKFTEQAKEYIPGTLTEDTYRSEYWDLEFQAEGNWIMADEADRKALSQETLANAKSSAAAALADEDISQDVKDAFIDSLYGATEMYALYVDEEGYCFGEANITVTQLYGLDEITSAEFLQGVVNNLATQFENVTISDISIAGKTYSVIGFSANQDGMVIHVKCIYMLKNISNCLIRITYVDGYENVYTSFLEQMSTYN